MTATTAVSGQPGCLWQACHTQDNISNFNTWVQRHYSQLPADNGNRGDHLRRIFLGENPTDGVEPNSGHSPPFKEVDLTDPGQTDPAKARQLLSGKQRLNPRHSEEVPKHGHRSKAQKRRAAHSKEKARKAQRATEEMKESCQPWQAPPKTRPSMLSKQGGQSMRTGPASTPNSKQQDCSGTTKEDAQEHVHQEDSTGPSRVQAQAESTASLVHGHLDTTPTAHKEDGGESATEAGREESKHQVGARNQGEAAFGASSHATKCAGSPEASPMSPGRQMPDKVQTIDAHSCLSILT